MVEDDDKLYNLETFRKFFNELDLELEAKRLEGVTRLELINHCKTNGMEQGRVLTLYKDKSGFKEIQVSYQDDGKTMKIFLV
jgi:hypothetical protein